MLFDTSHTEITICKPTLNSTQIVTVCFNANSCSFSDCREMTCREMTIQQHTENEDSSIIFKQNEHTCITPNKRET